MSKIRGRRRSGLGLLGVGVLLSALVTVGATTAGGAGAQTAPPSIAPSTTSVAGTVARATRRGGPKPTIVLVHGAFADASGWKAVADRLRADGYRVLAPPNPLRGLDYDAEYLRYFIDTIEGPVVLVGHSYGGAVITNAAHDNPQVEALVYVAAYALDEGETVDQANHLGGHPEESLLLANVQARPYPKPFPEYPDGDFDVYIKPHAFREVFAADLPLSQTRFMAVSQRPGSYFSLGTPSGPAGWETVPSWYLVALDDHAIPPTAQKVMARRAGARTTRVHSSHVAMMSHPLTVVRLIERADRLT